MYSLPVTYNSLQLSKINKAATEKEDRRMMTSQYKRLLESVEDRRPVEVAFSYISRSQQFAAWTHAFKTIHDGKAMMQTLRAVLSGA